MKKTLNKNLLILMALIMGISMMFSGCKEKVINEGNNVQKQESNVTTKKVETKPIETEPVEITYTTYRDLAANDSLVTKELPAKLKEKGMNVTFKIQEYGTYNPGEWEQKFKISMASGEQLCDVMQLPGVMPEGIKGGWYAELNMDLLKKTIPTYVQEVDSRFPILWASGKNAEDGKLYAVPSFNMYGPTRHVFLYREDWLKNMGMEVPKTLEDFENYLRAVRTSDPNGNGQADEYGYTGEDKGEGAPFREIFGAFGVMPGMWMEKNGQIVRGDILPEVKDALVLLKKWYSEGLIPKGVMTTAKDRDEFYANKIGAVGSGNAYGPAIAKGGYIDVAMSKIPGAELLVALPPVGPNGQSGTWQYGPKKYVLAFGKHLENDLEKLEIILKTFELIATDKELFEFTMLGEKGLNWDFVDNSAEKGAIKYLPPYEDVNLRLKDIGVRDLSESAFCPIWIESIYKNYIDPEALKYTTMNKQYYDAILQISLPSDTKYKADLITLSKVAYLEIITGNKPIEYFDEFIIKWNENGGEQLVKEANELYQKIK